jgi:hypothetical protein
MSGRGEPAYLFACAHNGVAISSSDVGIHWERPIRVIGEYDTKVQLRGDTDNHIFWSPEVGRYVVITRGIEFDGKEPLRSVVSIVGPERLCPENDGRIRESIGTGFSYPSVTLEGPLDAQPYSMPLRRLADGYYIGVVSILNYDSTKEFAYRVHTSLTRSRDGVNWRYLSGKDPYIPNAERFAMEKGNDYGMIYCAAPIEADGEMRIYYAAMPELHYFNYEDIPKEIKDAVDAVIPRAKEARRITRTTTLNYASFGIDRFAGLYSQDGVLCTKPIELKEGRLSLTADIEVGGEISARLLGEDGEPVCGFGFSDFKPLTESVTDREPVWRGDVSALAGKKISVELAVKGGTLYAINIE